MNTADIKPSAVRSLLKSRLSREEPRSAALITMTSDMVALALRGSLPQRQHELPSELQKAIIAATGCKVEKVFSDVPEEQFTRRLYPVHYADSLASSMRERHWARLRAGFEKAHGEEGWERARDEVWTALRADACPYGLKAWDDPNDAPRNTPGENLLTTLFYFISFATINDGESMEQMSGLVRLLPYAIPIGEWRQRSGHWLYVIHPVL